MMFKYFAKGGERPLHQLPQATGLHDIEVAMRAKWIGLHELHESEYLIMLNKKKEKNLPNVAC